MAEVVDIDVDGGHNANANDEAISNFLAFTGTSDPVTAHRYLEMAGHDLEAAVGLFLEMGAAADAAGDGRAGGGTTGGGGMEDEDDAAYAASLANEQQLLQQDDAVRAPDASRSMRLVGGYDDYAPVRRQPGDATRGGGGGGGGNNYNADEPPAALIAALGGPAAREMMRNMQMGANAARGGEGRGAVAMMGGMVGPGGGRGGMGMMAVDEDLTRNWGGNWASNPSSAALAGVGAFASDDARRRMARRIRDADRRSTDIGTGDFGVSNRRTGRSARAGSDDDDDEVQVMDADVRATEDDYNYDDDDDGDANVNAPPAAVVARGPTSLQTMFAPPTHLMHLGGGFQGARNFARDARRWLLCNIQSDDDFACHALNRDVWGDDLVENLVREGFVLWQATTTSADGQTYITRYKVTGYPHLAIIDPRTGSLLWRKEGWTQVNPLTAEQFVEIASDFCSRHSFDKLPTAARHAYANGELGASAGISSPTRPSSGEKRPIHELTEEEQLQAAIQASMKNTNEDDSDDDNVEVIKAVVGAKSDEADVNEDNNKRSVFEQEILTIEIGDEPTSGDMARVQIKMPDGKRVARKFAADAPVKLIFAFVAQSNDEARAGRLFELKAKFPPVDLLANADDGIKSCGLSGEAINVIWK